MSTLQNALDRASSDGIITADQVEKLLPYLDANPASVVASEVVDTETPRFVRGFHDILITIGVVIALVGVTGVGSFIAGAVTVVILAEILVRRQRLALPAVALTVATIMISTMSVGIYLDNSIMQTSPVLAALRNLAVISITVGLFAARYRVPIATAAWLASVCCLALACIFWGVQAATGATNVFVEYRALSKGILAAAAIALFVLAMRFDLSDPQRQTRRSDIAFWLHLVTAPALLLAMMSIFVTYNGSFVFQAAWHEFARSYVAIFPIVAVLMVIGVVIDRRAFVTSGLVSLIAAFVALIRNEHWQGTTDGTFFLALVFVGILVLTIGICWKALRRVVVGLLPSKLRAILPPAI